MDQNVSNKFPTGEDKSASVTFYGQGQSGGGAFLGGIEIQTCGQGRRLIVPCSHIKRKAAAVSFCLWLLPSSASASSFCFD